MGQSDHTKFTNSPFTPFYVHLRGLGGTKQFFSVIQKTIEQFHVSKEPRKLEMHRVHSSKRLFTNETRNKINGYKFISNKERQFRKVDSYKKRN